MREQTVERVKEARGAIVFFVSVALFMFGAFVWAIIREPFEPRMLSLIIVGLILLGTAGYFYFEYRREKKDLQEEDQE